jgi:hypothetical protein
MLMTIILCKESHLLISSEPTDMTDSDQIIILINLILYVIMLHGKILNYMLGQIALPVS